MPLQMLLKTTDNSSVESLIVVSVRKKRLLPSFVSSWLYTTKRWRKTSKDRVKISSVAKKWFVRVKYHFRFN